MPAAPEARSCDTASPNAWMGGGLAQCFCPAHEAVAAFSHLAPGGDAEVLQAEAARVWDRNGLVVVCRRGANESVGVPQTVQLRELVGQTEQPCCCCASTACDRKSARTCRSPGGVPGPGGP